MRCRPLPLNGSITAGIVLFYFGVSLFVGPPSVHAASIEESDAVLIWKRTRESNRQMKAVKELAGELDIRFRVERASRYISKQDARHSMSDLSAAVVVWHDINDVMHILFFKDGREQTISVSSGSFKEELLYLREFIRARFSQDEQVGSLLTAAPSEFFDMRDVNQSQAESQSDLILRNRWMFGVDYAMRWHFDDVIWPERGIQFVMPRYRINHLWHVASLLNVGFPTKIGGDSAPWLEISTFEWNVHVGIHPILLRWFELSTGLSLGLVASQGVAFYPNGQSQTSQAVSGQMGLWLGFTWRPVSRFGIKCVASGTYIVSPPKYGVGDSDNPGEREIVGSFFGFPWNVGMQVGLEVAIF